jgi:hypothetical protein
MHDVFEKAMFAHPPRIAGVRLNPFSAFHLLALQTLGSPFALGGQINTNDIVTCLVVCSSRYDDGLTRYERFANSFIRRAAWFINLVFRDLDEITHDLIEYVESYLEQPEYWTDADAPKSKVPAAYNVVVTVLTNLSQITEQEAWDMSLPKLNCYYACIAEQFGAKLADQDIAEAEQNLQGADNA